MTVYSGFATRNEQKQYDGILSNVISTLMVRIVKFYKADPINEQNFCKIIKQQYKTLSKMQKHKYIEPKYAELLQKFIKVLFSTKDPYHAVNKTSFNGHYKEQSFDESADDQIDNHVQFQMRRKSIIQQEFEETGLQNRTLSGLGKELNQLKNDPGKAGNKKHQDSEQENSDENQSLTAHLKDKPIYQRSNKKALFERSPPTVNHKKSKKKKKNRNHSIQSNIDLWDVRKQKLPEIPPLEPLEHAIMGRTRFKNFSENSQTAYFANPSESDIRSIHRKNQARIKDSDKTPQPKFRAKIFYK